MDQVGLYYALGDFEEGRDYYRSDEWAQRNFHFQRAIDGMLDVPKFAESLETAIVRRKSVLI